MCNILENCNKFILNEEEHLDYKLKMRLFDVQSAMYKIHNILINDRKR